jgi:hypothetical protein
MFKVSSDIYLIVYNLYYISQNCDLGIRIGPIHRDGGSTLRWEFSGWSVHTIDIVYLNILTMRPFDPAMHTTYRNSTMSMGRVIRPGRRPSPSTLGTWRRRKVSRSTCQTNLLGTKRWCKKLMNRISNLVNLLLFNNRNLKKRRKVIKKGLVR